jgi:hypothetical protein
MWGRLHQRGVFSDDTTIAAEPNPPSPKEVLYDACDVQPSIIMTWNLSDWMLERSVIEAYQLHERAIQEGSFHDRRRAYRFYHNFFACFPDHAAQLVPIECLTPVFNFVI